jgi:hypothetical protein
MYILKNEANIYLMNIVNDYTFKLFKEGFTKASS